MIGLNDNQLEAIMRVAAPLSEGECQEFLERVAAAVAVVMEMRGQINDEDVAVAVQLALRSLTHNSAAWQNWNRNRLPTATRRGRLPPWFTKFRNRATSAFADALALGKKYYLE
jgi:heme-degrading monooxygenase HmoA